MSSDAGSVRVIDVDLLCFTAHGSVFSVNQWTLFSSLPWERATSISLNTGEIQLSRNTVMDAGMWRMWREEIRRARSSVLSYTCAHLAAVQTASITHDYRCQKKILISKETLFVKFILIVCFGSFLPNEKHCECWEVERQSDQLSLYKSLQKEEEQGNQLHRQTKDPAARTSAFSTICWNTTISLNHKTNTLY